MGNDRATSIMSFKLFVVFHRNIIDGCYDETTFNKKHYTYIKCNESIPLESFDYDVIEEKDFNVYDKTLQERTYMAPSAIYHAYKNGLHEDLSHIGFLEYDLKLSEGFTKSMGNMTEHSSVVSPLSSKHHINTLISQNINMNGKNCWKQMVEDYNAFFGKKYTLVDISKGNDIVGTQQSFFMDTKTFGKIMKFIEYVVENKLCERPKSWSRPSTIMDRYFSMCMHIEKMEGVKYLPVKLDHLNRQDW
jgi:hypothetical protein